MKYRCKLSCYQGNILLFIRLRISKINLGAEIVIQQVKLKSSNIFSTANALNILSYAGNI